MALDPKDLPAVGDVYADGVVARTVGTAEGLEITIRVALEGLDEERPVSIPQTVHPDALVNLGAPKAEESLEEPEPVEEEKA